MDLENEIAGEGENVQDMVLKEIDMAKGEKKNGL